MLERTESTDVTLCKTVVRSRKSVLHLDMLDMGTHPLPTDEQEN